MRKFAFLFVFSSLILVKFHAQNNCPACAAALIKDQYQSYHSNSQRLRLISSINKEEYDALKKQSSDGVDVGLL